MIIQLCIRIRTPIRIVLRVAKDFLTLKGLTTMSLFGIVSSHRSTSNNN